MQYTKRSMVETNQVKIVRRNDIDYINKAAMIRITKIK